jgi:hypothetical protein
MPRKKPEQKTRPIDSIKHADESRTNIPTKELRDFVADDEQEPKMKLYPRNPDLAPSWWLGNKKSGKIAKRFISGRHQKRHTKTFKKCGINFFR